MKKMYKILVLCLVLALSVSLLTGCGKSKEEKAYEEIANHMREEAAADGIDLDKELANAQAGYEKRNEEYIATQKSASEIKDHYDPLIRETKEKFVSATTKSDIEKYANEANELITERCEALAAIGKNGNLNHRCYSDEAIYLKTLYHEEFQSHTEYGNFLVYRDKEAGIEGFIPVLYNKISDGECNYLIYRQGRPTLALNSADYIDPSSRDVYISNVFADCVVLHSRNADGTGEAYYFFDISGNSLGAPERVEAADANIDGDSDYTLDADKNTSFDGVMFIVDCYYFYYEG